MTDIKKLGRLMNCVRLTEDWNLSYGVTKTRNDALIGNGSNGFFNPKSETALTLFMLGNIDGWKQIGTLNRLPRRDKGSRWDKKFFKNISNQDIYNSGSQTDVLWTQLIENICKCDKSHLENSVLLFEFRIMNSAFHSIGNKPFKELSFLDIKKRKKWSQFDAVLIIPRKKLFIFFESKLLGYKDNSSKQHSDKPSQIFRNLESAYLLTNHEKSFYKGWNFAYMFITPRNINELNSYYSKLDNVDSEYEKLLEGGYKSSVNRYNYNEYFKSFKKDISNHIIKIHWEKLGEILQSKDPDFFQNYLNNLNKARLERHIGHIKERFFSAGINYDL